MIAGLGDELGEDQGGVDNPYRRFRMWFRGDKMLLRKLVVCPAATFLRYPVAFRR